MIRNKLARSKRVIKPLNKSSDDFQDDVKVKKCSVESKNEEAKSQESEEKENGETESNLPPCPLCGKTFRPGQFTTRGSHMKLCGSSRGMTTEQLIQIRQLEEKQAEERRALGLPEINNGGNKEEKKKKKKTANSRKRGNEVIFDIN